MLAAGTAPLPSPMAWPHSSCLEGPGQCPLSHTHGTCLQSRSQLSGWSRVHGGAEAPLDPPHPPAPRTPLVGRALGCGPGRWLRAMLVCCRGLAVTRRPEWHVLLCRWVQRAPSLWRDPLAPLRSQCSFPPAPPGARGDEGPQAAGRKASAHAARKGQGRSSMSETWGSRLPDNHSAEHEP